MIDQKFLDAVDDALNKDYNFRLMKSFIKQIATTNLNAISDHDFKERAQKMAKKVLKELK